MRIIDKNTDFYDYLQNIYYDKSVTFDRTDSFVLTKEEVCNALYSTEQYGRNEENGRLVLLQVCNTFWIFLVEITSRDKNSNKPEAYTVELLHKWKNYNKERKLLGLDLIDFGYREYHLMNDYILKENRGWVFNREKTKKNVDRFIMFLNNGDFRVRKSFNNHTIYRGDDVTVEKHIPLLKASGLASEIDPLDIFTSLEEYFSLEKQSKERTESIDITDKEKAENHGFDSKASFRKEKL